MKDMSNIVYWYKNQVVITYHSPIPMGAKKDDVLTPFPTTSKISTVSFRNKKTSRPIACNK